MANSEMDATQTVEIGSLYFKPGTDLSWHMEGSDSPAAAFRSLAESLRAAATRLEAIARIVEQAPPESVSISADTHYIGMSLPAPLAERLLEAELVERPLFGEDEEEWEDEEGMWDDFTLKPGLYLEHIRSGDIEPGEIDLYIDFWHTQKQGALSLHDFLGLSLEEYGRWVQDADSIVPILREKGVLGGEDAP